MSPTEFDAMLASTLADKRLSRSEKKALQEVFEESAGKPEQLAVLRSRVFEAARQHAGDAAARELVEWCEEMTKLLVPQTGNTRAVAEACFSPGTACVNKINSLIAAAQQAMDVCVFTITDDRIAEAILKAHARKVKVRVLSDNEKSEDLGSDIPRFSKAGIPVVVDRTPSHMHHKFAVFDKRLLLTGSYNWTRSAADENEENLIVTNDLKLVGAFSATFERLWKSLAR
jgi:phosphatidylserine/phosphatidylglycerophosphate/cardiolipin synthase-like enzyme